MVELPEIVMVPVESIDPESTVNVRRSAVTENVERVKESIARRGYLPERAIVIRPHPQSDSGYPYEVVEGLCRFKAAAELGHQEIPAFVKDLADDAAIQQSWNENEARGDLKPSDKAYWTETIFNKFWRAGKTRDEAFAEAAEFLGVTIQTAKNYAPLAYLPEEVLHLMDQGQLTEAEGRALANSISVTDPYARERLLERAQWITGLDRQRRRHVPGAIAAQWDAGIEDLEKRLEEAALQENRTVTIEIPQEDRKRLLAWGKERGLSDLNSIIAHLVATSVRGHS